jgi:signal transduction histidine kinase
MSTLPGTVWLLEDSRLEASIAQKALTDEFDVEWFTDGESLLEQLAHRRPKLLLLDVALPGISGIDVCRFVRARFDERVLPALFLTAHESQANAVDVLGAGANDFVRKPYDSAELRARVRTLVRLANAHETLGWSVRRAQLAADVGVALTARTSTREALQASAEAIVRHLEAAFARIWTTGPSGDELLLQTSAGMYTSTDGAHARVPVGCPKVAKIAAGRRPIFTNDVANDAGFGDRAWARREGMVAFAGYPLLVENKLVGVVALFARHALPETLVSDLATVAHTIAIGIDRAHAEEARVRLLDSERRAREDAERSNRAKDEFLSTISHELRTPLNAVLGWARMLSQGREGKACPEDVLQRGLETIERNAVAQAQLIEDLLDVSRITTGKLRLDLQPLALTQVVEAAVESVRPAANAKEQQIHCVLDSDGSIVTGDAGRLQQVVWNLLNNAIKFTPKRGKIRVELRRVDAHVELSIVDTGQGIHRTFLPHVFERFEQQDPSATRRHGGLGLGLAISKHIVELHGGTIRADSNGEGTGATFVVGLPSTVSGESVSGKRSPLDDDLGPKYAPELEGLKVLVVDDDPDARELVGFVLGKCGADPTLVASAFEGLASIERSPPDVLLSDVGMPGEDGYGFIRRVRALPRDRGGQTPAAVLTAYARAEDRRRALNAGYQMYVTKPIVPAELVAIVVALARVAATAK